MRARAACGLLQEGVEVEEGNLTGGEMFCFGLVDGCCWTGWEIVDLLEERVGWGVGAWRWWRTESEEGIG